MKKQIVLVGLVGSLMLSAGCQVKPPADAFKLTEASLEARQLQSRIFETKDETALLSAGIAVLQDMGYTVNEAEKNAGLVTASKSVDATDGKQIAGALLLALLGANMPLDTVQVVRVSFVTYPARSQDGYVSRITFQRIIHNNQGGSRVETLDFPELYTEFFDKLSKSVFLEAQSI
jgi:hypothetical protein